MVKIFIFAIFLYACSVTAQKPTISQLYDDCGTPGKKCWGDRDGCIETRQCTYAMSVGQNSTHYTIIMVNGCAEPKKTLKHFFLGVGYDTFDANGVRVCRDPSIDDFKGFIFWKDGVKCPPGRTYAFEIFWTYRKKDNLRRMCEYEQNVHGTKIEPKFNLTNYMRNYIFLKAGDDTYPYEFADKTDYKYVNGLYINRQPATVEPEDPKIPISVKPYAPEVPIGYHGNDTTGNGGGATYRIPDSTGVLAFATSLALYLHLRIY